MVFDRLIRQFKVIHGVVPGNIFSVNEVQYHQAGQHREKVGHDHPAGIFDEPDPEKIGRNNIDQVAHNEGRRGGIGDEPAGHHERQYHPVLEFQRPHHRQYDGGENERGTVVCEEGGHNGTENGDEYEHPDPVAIGKPCHVQRGPFKKADFIQNE